MQDCKWQCFGEFWSRHSASSLCEPKQRQVQEDEEEACGTSFRRKVCIWIGRRLESVKGAFIGHVVARCGLIRFMDSKPTLLIDYKTKSTGYPFTSKVKTAALSFSVLNTSELSFPIFYTSYRCPWFFLSVEEQLTLNLRPNSQFYREGRNTINETYNYNALAYNEFKVKLTLFDLLQCNGKEQIITLC